MLSPEHTDWNRFWSRPASKQFSQISWSKKRILNILSRYATPKKKAFDAGCGSGFFSKYFCDQKMFTIAADYSDSALDMAKTVTKNQCQLLKVDFLTERLNSRLSERFDLIFSDGLLEHFSSSQQDAIVQNWASILDSKGVMITFVPNRFSPWEIIRPLYMPGIEEKPFVLSELVRVHERNGLQIVEKGGINTLPFAFSPDQWVGSYFGMLLYVVARRVAPTLNRKLFA